MYHVVIGWDPFCVPLFLYSPPLFVLLCVTYSYCSDLDIVVNRKIQINRQRGRKQKEKGEDMKKRVTQQCYSVLKKLKVLFLSLIKPTSLLPSLLFF